MMVNKNEMKFYNNMKKPSKIKLEYKRKPRMVEIIEDNYIYKNRDNNDNPFPIYFKSLNKNKSAFELGEKKGRKEEKYNENNKKMNIINFGNNIINAKIRNKNNSSKEVKSNLFSLKNYTKNTSISYKDKICENI